MNHYFIFLPLLFSYFHIVFALDVIRTPCHNDGNFIASDADLSLSSANIVATNQVKTATECAINCMQNDQCQSYNYQHTSTDELHQCELLDAVKGDNVLSSRPQYKHYEPVLSSVCSMCNNHGACVTSCGGGEFCICDEPSFSGLLCEKVMCPALSQPDNSWMQVNNEGNVTQFECVFKFVLVGSSTIACQPDATWETTAPTCEPDTSGTHDVRLVGSEKVFEGNVEIYSAGRWGAISHDGWDIDDARVVCKQLGLDGALAAYSNSEFGSSPGPIFLTGVACTGAEAELSHCSASDATLDCALHQTAGVRCKSTLRLAEGTSSSGRLEMYLGGAWGSVCNDYWVAANTDVACRQLGFSSGVSAASGTLPGTGDIVLDDVVCVGTESDLLECSYVTTHNCGHTEDIAITCS